MHRISEPEGAGACMKRKFIVTLDMPQNVTVREMSLYIEEAVATWHGQEDPETPIFDLDGDSVKVKPVPTRKD